MRVLGFVLAMLLAATPGWPQSAPELARRGNEYVSKGDYASAIEAYTQALKLEPSSASILYLRGYAYYRNYQDDQAIHDFSAVIQITPKSEEAFRGRAQAYEDKADYEHAIQDYTQAIQLKPADAVLLYDRAFDYERRGQYGPALLDLTELVRRFPDTADAYRNRGLVLLLLGRISEAQEDLGHAVQLYPTDHYNVIWLYIARAKNGSAAVDELARNASRLDSARWPGPVIQLFLGKNAPDAVLQTALDKNEKKNSQQRCEAEFYIAEYHALHGQRVAAAQNFRLATEICDKNYFLYAPSARAELLATTK